MAQAMRLIDALRSRAAAQPRPCSLPLRFRARLAPACAPNNKPRTSSSLSGRSGCSSLRVSEVCACAPGLPRDTQKLLPLNPPPLGNRKGRVWRPANGGTDMCAHGNAHVHRGCECERCMRARRPLRARPRAMHAPMGSCVRGAASARQHAASLADHGAVPYAAVACGPIGERQALGVGRRQRGDDRAAGAAAPQRQ